MKKKWYCQIGDQRIGPIDSRELKRMADDGELKPSDQVWIDGWHDWTFARGIDRLWPRIRDDRGAVRGNGPPPVPAEQAESHDAVLFDCSACGRSHFVTVDDCPSAVEAARETRQAERQLAAA